jgi:hypothetical protein
MTALAFNRFECQVIRHHFTRPICFPGVAPENTIGTRVDSINGERGQQERLLAAGRRNGRPLFTPGILIQRLPSRKRLSKEWRIRPK